jgi:VanZ family protein
MDPARKFGEGRRTALWPALLAVVITCESVCAVPSIGPPALSIDKLAHFAVFGLLATTIVRLEAAGRWRWLGAWWAVVMVSAFGGATELLQSLTPMRSMEFDDWLADSFGAAVATAAYLHGTSYRRLLERRVRRRPADPPQPRVEISPEPRPNQAA